VPGFFAETGTTANGEPLFQFTHRTFLEYFTASYIVRTNYTPEALFNQILPRVASREWDNVSQLAVQLLNKAAEGSGDEVLRKLIEESTHGSSQQRVNQLSFAARCLNFLVPSPHVTRELTNVCVQLSVQLVIAGKKGNDGGRGAVDLLAALVQASVENRPYISAEIERIVSLELGEPLGDRGRLLFELGMHLGSARFASADSQVTINDEAQRYWSDLGTRVFSNS
jgi:hypothetical protein